MNFLDKILKHYVIKLRSDIKFKERYVNKLLADIKNYELESKKLREDHLDEIDKQKKFFSIEIESVKCREASQWKVLLDERDGKIIELQKYIDENKKLYDFLKERDTAFDEMFSLISNKLTSSVNLHAEADKTLLMAGSKYQAYKDRYLQSDKKIEENLKME